MRFLLFILVVLSTLSACNRRQLPAPSIVTVTKDSIVERLTVKDSIIRIPGETVVINDTLPCPDVVAANTVSSGRLRASYTFKNGLLNINCNSDSLLKAIRWLEAQKEFYKSSSTTIKEPYPVVKLEPYVPKWVIAVCVLNLLCFTYYFRKPISKILGFG